MRPTSVRPSVRELTGRPAAERRPQPAALLVANEGRRDLLLGRLAEGFDRILRRPPAFIQTAPRLRAARL